jgi:hypothetical protein
VYFSSLALEQDDSTFRGADDLNHIYNVNPKLGKLSSSAVSTCLGMIGQAPKRAHEVKPISDFRML